MSSKSTAKHISMAAIAHNPAFAKKSKAERLAIINDVTTKPQRMEIVDKVFTAKKMKEGGLYANINAKRDRIAEGSGERMRKAGSKGAPTPAAFKQSAKTAKAK
jgi:DNA polymerase/3'-5' exonuclease PolX